MRRAVASGLAFVVLAGAACGSVDGGSDPPPEMVRGLDSLRALVEDTAGHSGGAVVRAEENPSSPCAGGDRDHPIVQLTIEPAAGVSGAAVVRAVRDHWRARYPGLDIDDRADGARPQASIDPDGYHLVATAATDGTGYVQLTGTDDC
jgi:hypothetical protein